MKFRIFFMFCVFSNSIQILNNFEYTENSDVFKNRRTVFSRLLFNRMSELSKWYVIGKLWTRRNFFVHNVFSNSKRFKSVFRIIIRPFVVTGTEWFLLQFLDGILKWSKLYIIWKVLKRRSFSYLTYFLSPYDLKLILEVLKSHIHTSLQDDDLILMG